MIVDPDFPDHWKTRLLVDCLDGDAAAPVYVLRLWAHCQNRRTHIFHNITTAALKALCRYPGHPNKLEAGLSASGFVRRAAGVLIVHEWERYNASLIAAWKNGSLGGRPPNKNPDETPGLPTANPDETDKSRVDKRREDKSRVDKRRVGEFVAAGEPARDRRIDVSTDEMFIAEIRRNYTGIDVDAELAKMRGWLLTPKGKGKRLTRSRIVNWLNRCDSPVTVHEKPKGKYDQSW